MKKLFALVLALIMMLSLVACGNAPAAETTGMIRTQLEEALAYTRYLLGQEVPHGVALAVDSFEEEEGLISIYVVIYCSKDSHKGIIIGKHGDMLKKISSMARADCEKFMGTRVYLTTWVKVKENWRESDFLVRNFGYRE